MIDAARTLMSSAFERLSSPNPVLPERQDPLLPRIEETRKARTEAQLGKALHDATKRRDEALLDLHA